MSDAMIIDNREFLAYMAQLKRVQQKGIAVNIIRSYVNNIGRAAQFLAAAEVNRSFKFKNTSTKKFLIKGVVFDKARDGAPGTPFSTVGAIGDPHKLDYTQHRAEILARQEMGGNVEQIKAGKGSMRKALIAPDPRHNKNKFSPRLKSKIALPKAGTRETKPGRIHAATIRHARIARLPYAMTPFGLYKIFRGKVGGTSRTRIDRIQTFKKRIKTTAAPWLMPAAKEAMRNRERYFREAYEFRMSKALGGKQNGVMA